MNKVIVAALRTDESDEAWQQRMEEMQRLCEACGMTVLASLTQRAERPWSRTLLGQGKCLQLKELAWQRGAEGVVFLNDLSGMQLRNLNQLLQVETVDRSALILMLFERSARTRQAVLQVQAARLAWQRSRLVQGQIGADQQQGGGFRNRGAGESRLELNRRTLDRQLKTIRRRLDQLKVQDQTRRDRRQRSGLPRVCLIGYSNAGKSSLMNALLCRQGRPQAKQVLQRDQLFATLDSSVRRMRLKDGRQYLLADTVGFVRDLPDFLLEAFESTLQELKQADLLIEVIDAADASWPYQHHTVWQTLQRLDAAMIPVIRVYNKIDLVTQWQRLDGIAISCRYGQGLDELQQQIADALPASGIGRQPWENQDEIDDDLVYNGVKEEKRSC